MMEYDTVSMATDDFSNYNKLGEGGFGTVYKGHPRRLESEQHIAYKDMIPKILDFGMARIFGRDNDEATTRRIVGTYGYMPLEYAIDGIYSDKSDVFSFGVLLLEIVTGKKNRGFTSSDRDSNLLSYVWRNTEEGTWHEVVDPKIIDLSLPSPTYQPDEILRCITIGLTCVQEYAEETNNVVGCFDARE